jgi:hypothetical protein
VYKSREACAGRCLGVSHAVECVAGGCIEGQKRDCVHRDFVRVSVCDRDCIPECKNVPEYSCDVP